MMSTAEQSSDNDVARVELNECDVAHAVLQSGDVFLHHGKVFYGSNANRSNDRRIGLATCYISP